MKTINELNEKIWYRLIKVIFAIIFLCVSLFVVIGIYNQYKSRETDDYTVTCNYGNRNEFEAINDKQILITDFDLKNGISSISDYKKELIQKACAISDQELKVKFDAILNKTDDGKSLFDVRKSKVNVGSNLKATVYSLFGLAIVLAIFEVLKRVFYYIILGTPRPKKE